MEKVIFEGLKNAVQRGQSLQNAMASFLNAGYSRQEIENAARALQQQRTVQSFQPQTKSTIAKPKKSFWSRFKSKKPEKKVSSYSPTENIPKKPAPQVFKKPVKQQKVSNYETKVPGPRRDWMLFIMVFILVALLGVLISVFFFKAQLVELLDKLF